MLTVVDVAVIVVISAVATDFTCVDPLVSAKVGVGHVDARIHNGNGDVGASSRVCPRSLHVDGGKVLLLRVPRVIRIKRSDHTVSRPDAVARHDG